MINYPIRGDFRLLCDSPAPIVSMIQFQGRILVATTENLYELRKKQLVLLELELAPDTKP